MRIKLLVLAFAIVTSINICAQEISGIWGQNLSWTLRDSVLTISGSGEMKDYNGDDVGFWYPYRNVIKSIIIGDSVTSLGKKAFFGCSTATSITIPNGITSVGDYAFVDCGRLTSIPIPNSVTRIGIAAFYKCKSLTSFTIPDSVTSIEGSTFFNCQSLTSIAIHNRVASFGAGAFTNCISLTSVAIPNGIKRIENGTFEGCSSLTSITIPDSVTRIGFAAFERCTSLTSITIPDCVTSIDTATFEGCSSLTSVTLPNSITRIKLFAFSHCSSLTSINIPDSVTNIDIFAFSDCTSLTSITIPSSVTKIGAYGFSGCSQLDTVYVECLTPPQLENSPFHNAPSTLKIYVPCGTLDAYKNAWKEYANQIQYPLSAIIHTAPLVEGTGSVSVPMACDTILEAIPAEGYHFVKWTDGNTDNPRVIDPEVEATYIAEFALDESAIERVPEDSATCKFIHNGHIHILLPDGTRYDATGRKEE